jgi:hypothetical protein
MAQADAAAQRLRVTAVEDWWGVMTPELKKKYVQEHPKSAYVKKYYSELHGEDPDEPDGGVKQKEENPPPPPASSLPSADQVEYSPKDAKAAKAATVLPKSAKQFLSQGGTNQSSEQRKVVGAAVKQQSPSLAKSVMKDVVGADERVKKLRKHSVPDQPAPEDKQTVAQLIGDFLSTSAFRDAINALGPVGMLIFAAMEKIGEDRLWSLAHGALSSFGEHGDYGYYKCTWVNVTPEEWQALLAKGLQGVPQSNVPAVKQPINAALRLIEMDDVPQANSGSEGGPEQQLTSLFQAISDYAANGVIPPEAWDDSIKRMAAQITRVPQKPI